MRRYVYGTFADFRLMEELERAGNLLASCERSYGSPDYRCDRCGDWAEPDTAWRRQTRLLGLAWAAEDACPAAGWCLVDAYQGVLHAVCAPRPGEEPGPELRSRVASLTGQPVTFARSVQAGGMDQPLSHRLEVLIQETALVVRDRPVCCARDSGSEEWRPADYLRAVQVLYRTQQQDSGFRHVRSAEVCARRLLITFEGGIRVSVAHGPEPAEDLDAG